MLRIAFDAQSSYGVKSGLGVYTTALMAALQRQHVPGVEIDFYPEKGSRFHGPLNTPRRLQWEMLGFPACVKGKPYHIVHVPAFAMGWPAAKKILTVHDLIGMTFPNQAGIASRFYWKNWLAWAVKRADHLIADSEHTRQDLIHLLKIPEKRITRIYPSGHEGFRSDFPEAEVANVKSKLKIAGRYFIFVGTFEPRKNLPRVMDSFKVFLDSHSDYQLVLVGSGEFAHGEYMASLMRSHTLNPDRVITPGFIDPTSLNMLYCGAEALLFPSLYEGFGIPILEAMASGCPVITSNITSTPEVAGDAGILVNPYDIAAIAQAMQDIVENPETRQILRQKGFKQIQKFSWDLAAEQTLKVYQQC